MTTTAESLYRETITGHVKQVYTHKNQTGGAGEYAEVLIEFAPRGRGSGVAFVSGLRAGELPAAYIEAVQAGLMEQAETGIVRGFPAIDFVATLVDAKYHDVDSSPEIFRIAAGQCFREGMRRAGPVLLEPLISLTVITPQDHVGDIVGALNRRGGWIFGQVSVGTEITLAASLGLSAIDGFRDDLERSTEGRGSLTMAAEPHEYVVVRDMDDPDPTFPGAIGARAVA